jgi:Trk K+ transport system NAD-binding subunit
MGFPLAENLCEHGYEVVAYDINQELVKKALCRKNPVSLSL